MVLDKIKNNPNTTIKATKRVIASIKSRSILKIEIDFVPTGVSKLAPEGQIMSINVNVINNTEIETITFIALESLEIGLNKPKSITKLNNEIKNIIPKHTARKMNIELCSDVKLATKYGARAIYPRTPMFKNPETLK